LPEESRTLLNEYVHQNYETLKQKSKFTVWAALLHACQQKGIVAPSYVTFCSAARRRPAFESTLKRKGPRAAYTQEPFYWELDPRLPGMVTGRLKLVILTIPSWMWNSCVRTLAVSSVVRG
jgi:putative transposase